MKAWPPLFQEASQEAIIRGRLHYLPLDAAARQVKGDAGIFLLVAVPAVHHLHAKQLGEKRQELLDVPNRHGNMIQPDDSQRPQGSMLLLC
jgi:hypothetical protein